MRDPVVIIGAGPAGLTAAHELLQRGTQALVLERDSMVGGLARTEAYKGFQFDVGGHRFYTKVDEIQRLWVQMLGDDLLSVSRLSRILYKGRFLRYPLDAFNALTTLGLGESALVLSSYLRAQLRPSPSEETFEDWVANRFGQRLYRTFFKRYTEKVWGIPCDTISADWAAQRIKGLSLGAALRNALFGTNGVRSLVDEFHYPRLGPGMMWRRFQDAIERQGGEVRLDTEVVRLHRSGARITGVTARHAGGTARIAGDRFISSMPITHLVRRIEGVPDEVLSAASQLQYRAFILVGLIVGRADLFPDNWIYVHNPDVRAGRIQNFKNWSGAMVTDASKTSVGVEYFCSEGDSLWSMSDAALIQLAARELTELGLSGRGDVEDGVVYRHPMAYPVYTRDYQLHLNVIRRFLGTIDNLQTVGRNGLHRYNNQDHSMLTGLCAVRNLFGESHDVWAVNTERSYVEEFIVTDHTATGANATTL
jgi:protoporphyrinogen oxidase